MKFQPFREIKNRAVELLQLEKDYLEYHELKLPIKDVVERGSDAVSKWGQCGEIHHTKTNYAFAFALGGFPNLCGLMTTMELLRVPPRCSSYTSVFNTLPNEQRFFLITGIMTRR